MDVAQEIDDITNLSKSLFNSMMFDNANGNSTTGNVTLTGIILQKLTHLQQEIYKN